MKNLYLLAILLTYTISNAQIVDIPDANFKNALVNTNCVDITGDFNGDVDADTNNDGEIQLSEAEAVITLIIENENISSLEGLQSFINIEDLLLDNDQLTDLDVTQLPNLNYLLCKRNQLTSLDVTQNPNLEYLFFDFNQVTGIDLTQNSNLRVLTSWDNQLISLNLTQNPDLFTLDCRDNQIDNLNLSQNPNLVFMLGSNNQLNALDVSNGSNSIMQIMWAHDNPNLTCIKVDNENATYPVCDIINYEGWCKDASAQYSEFCELGIEDYNKIAFTIFPNPAQNILNIESDWTLENVKIYSMQGVLLKEFFSTSLDISQLSAGMYFIQLSSEGKRVTKKFIKE